MGRGTVVTSSSRMFRVLRILSLQNTLLGATMVIPLGISLVEGSRDIFAFAVALPVTLLINGGLFFFSRKAEGDLSHRDGFLVVSLSWITACLFGSIPFALQPEFGGIASAVFESVSGFTTTGSTILTDIDILPAATLWWRSIIQWYGGMGIIVLALAILPVLGVGGMQLFKAEVPGPTADKLLPRIKDTALALWAIYLGMTLAEAFLLFVAGFSAFDAICHAFTTMATGGFGTHDDSMMTVGNAWTDVIFIVFMGFAGMNFALHFAWLRRGRVKALWEDHEFRVYFGVILVMVALFTGALMLGGVVDSFWMSLRQSAFQVLSLVTTTGYNSADFEAWGVEVPALAYFCFLLLFTGGMAGSTSGGVKIVRLWLIVKLAYRNLFLLIHPRAVMPVKVSNRTVSEEVVSSVTAFLVLYLLVFLLTMAALSFMNYDFLTAATAAATALGNVGPGLGAVGPTDNFAHLPVIGKWLLIVCMLLGRLEIYTLLILLVPEFWRH